MYVDPPSQTVTSPLWHKKTNHKIPVGKKFLTSLPLMPCDFPTETFQAEKGGLVLTSVSRFFLTYVWVISMTEVRLFCSDYFWGKILLKFLTHATFYLDSIISSLKFLESHRLLTLICNYNSTGAWMGSWDGLGAVEKRVIFWPSFCRFLGRQYGGLVALLTGLSSSLNEFLLLAISNL